MSVGIIGLGRMGRCLVQGLTESKTLERSQILFTTKHPDTAKKVREELGISFASDNRALVKASDTVVLAVKPQNVAEVLAEIADVVTERKTILSIVASISTFQIE